MADPAGAVHPTPPPQAADPAEDVRPSGLKARLQDGQQLLGVLLRMPAEDTVAMLGQAGFDFVFLDCEHGPADVLALRQHIALAQLHGLGVLVRIGAGEDHLALRVLDVGAEGIVSPHIDTAAQAQELVRAVHYPPLGARGFATYTPAGSFGAAEAEAHRQQALRRTLVIAMLESPTATGDSGAILATEGIDGYLIGKADLRAASGPDDLPVDEAVALVHSEADAVGSLRMDLVNDASSARSALADGTPLIVYNLTHVLLDLFRELRVRPGTAPESSPEPSPELSPGIS